VKEYEKQRKREKEMVGECVTKGMGEKRKNMNEWKAERKRRRNEETKNKKDNERKEVCVNE